MILGKTKKKRKKEKKKRKQTHLYVFAKNINSSTSIVLSFDLPSRRSTAAATAAASPLFRLSTASRPYSSRSRTSAVVSTRWVTSSGMRVVLAARARLAKMEAAASGSASTLNSANWVQLPTRGTPATSPSTAGVKPPPTAPPISDRPRTCATRSGYLANSAAALVKAPVATTHAVPGRHARSAAYAASMAAGSVRAATAGSGSRSVPSSPVSPCMSVGACIAGRCSALAAPMYTGMESALPMAVRMEQALRVVFLESSLSGRGGPELSADGEGEIHNYSSEALPKTVETPRMRIAGW